MIPIDTAWLEDWLATFLRTSTEVPLGQTEVEPGDPRIIEAVERVILPEIEALGPEEIRRHPAGDAAARFGPDGEDGLLLQTYVVSQHGNLMDDPLSGSITDGAAYGVEGRVAIGQGATQNKGSMAACLAALRSLQIVWRRPVWFTVNTEGKSSHGGSRRLFDDLGVMAAHGVVVIGTDLRVSLGNRGRVDVRISVLGASSHSSQPSLGRNPLEGAAEVIVRLRDLPVPLPHADLGPVSATPYQVACHPVAPHTIPERTVVVVDRRLLPGETPAQATEGIRVHLATLEGVELVVEEGASMLPAIVDEGAPVVRALVEGLGTARGTPGETFWSMNAFDAGYPCSRGISTPMFGPGKRGFAGAGLTGTDLVAIRDCELAAQTYVHVVRELCA